MNPCLAGFGQICICVHIWHSFVAIWVSHTFVGTNNEEPYEFIYSCLRVRSCICSLDHDSTVFAFFTIIASDGTILLLAGKCETPSLNISELNMNLFLYVMANPVICSMTMILFTVSALTIGVFNHTILHIIIVTTSSTFFITATILRHIPQRSQV